MPSVYFPRNWSHFEWARAWACVFCRMPQHMRSRFSALLQSVHFTDSCACVYASFCWPVHTPSLPVRTQYFSKQRRRLSMNADWKIWPVGIISWAVSCIARIEMATKAKSKGIINDTTPLMCTIEGIAKKEHVVSPLQWWRKTYNNWPIGGRIRGFYPAGFILLPFLLIYRTISWKCNVESVPTIRGRYILS